MICTSLAMRTPCTRFTTFRHTCRKKKQKRGNNLSILSLFASTPRFPPHPNTNPVRRKDSALTIANSTDNESLGPAATLAQTRTVQQILSFHTNVDLGNDTVKRLQICRHCSCGDHHPSMSILVWKCSLQAQNPTLTNPTHICVELLISVWTHKIGADMHFSNTLKATI